MTEEVRRWLVENAIPLKTLHPEASEACHGDLEPLREVLRDVRVLGMGEATHGTAEFFRLKHVLLRFLVEEMGFTALAMEASVSAARAVDDYVLHGTGDAAEALAGLGFWTWRTREMLDVVRWMRDHNRTVPEDRAVRFVGIDPQRCGPSLVALAAVLRTLAPQRADITGGLLGTLGEARPGSLVAQRTQLLAEALDLERFLQAERDRIAAHSGDAAVGQALEHARLIMAAADVASRPLRGDAGETGALAARDRHMAQEVISAEERPAAKVAVWAHNGHVCTGRYARDIPAMGQHLREHYGDRYYALGLLFGRGAFRARPGNSPTRPPRKHGISAAGPRSVESRLASATPQDHMIDLRGGRARPAVARWLESPQSMRSFGAGVPRVTYRFSMAPTVLMGEYDGLAYVARSTPSTPLTC
ncbi:erythromycin esterase family protein [Streptomyces actinomycinicus]|uniref:Erythromycin esterase family protein n=1 Tax=Streptomyces actinomycinicus TaxID=1695166 RepID=A0A937EK17_9ACTN|nr:erythromycin esterase family protein [Streptomyces actinomycinicus]MBL1083685.1 erythromycin esterase family protein [Streptomyces actinomycinicus]